MWVWTLLVFLPGSMPLLPNELYHQVKSGEQAGKGAVGSPQVEYLVGTSPVCSRIPGLSPGQRKFCQLYQDHMRSVMRGAAAAVSECRWQFNFRRWNCSALNKKNIFNRASKGGNRETAFTTALVSAAVAHSVTMACRDGQLSSCSCSRARRPATLAKDYVWGGCGDDLDYGYRFTKEFIDVREKEKGLKKSRDRDKRAMTLHNNEAGRWAVIHKKTVACKCHGLSGSCSLITCWQQLAPFREVGDLLKEKYDEAIEVTVEKGKLLAKDPQYTSRKGFGLVYFEESPNYCVKNMSLGVPGTQGRVCNRTSIGMDGCNLLCCGRGYNTQKTTSKQMCNCRFVWCCNVQCQQCVENVEVHTCK